MEYLTFDGLRDELDESHREQLRRLYYWLHCSCGKPWTCRGAEPCDCEGGSCTEEHCATVPQMGDLSELARHAPSPATRSEVQMFGRSFPRFALRIYLQEDRKAFINTRRLRFIGPMMPTEWNYATEADYIATGLEEVDEGDKKKPADFLQSSSCLADGLLPLPKRLADYQVLEVELGISYGEGKEVVGTPYIQGLNFSGLCAQSVCFMANALLLEHCKNLYGIAEISALASPPPDFTKQMDSPLKKALESNLLLGGLTLEDMTRFFGHLEVGLFAETQYSDDDQTYPSFDLALRSYVRSGSPVILPVDIHRMSGRTKNNTGKLRIHGVGIYQGNGVSTAELGRPGYLEPGGHAIVVVGSHRSDDGSWTYLFNDPAMHPFMTASAEELSNAATYKSNFSGLRNPTFLPVTPAQAKLPLTEWQDGNRRYGGVAQIARFIQLYAPRQGDDVENLPDWPTVPMGAMNDAEWRLTTIDRAAALACGDDAFCNGETLTRLERILGALESANWSPEQFIWIQVLADSVWVWDAECPPPRSGSQDYWRWTLIALLGTAGEAPERDWTNPRCPTPFRKVVVDDHEDEVEVETDPDAMPLRRSIISSFDTRGLTGAIRNWPDSLDTIDLYAFWHSDAVTFLTDGESETGGGSAVDLMAAAANNPDRIDGAAQKVHDLVSPKGITIASMATFVPEITNLDEHIRQQGRDALRFCLYLADELNTRHGHDIRSMELVGGARCDRIWLGRDPKSSELTPVIGRLSEGEGLQRLVGQLGKLAPMATEKNIRLAVEMEPGPLFLLRNEAMMQAFLDLVDRLPDSQIIGANLDVAHWGLIMKIQPEAIPERLKERLFHVHLADHSDAHLADLALTRKNPLDVFRPWIELCRTLPNFDGVVSLELEAASTIEEVKLSVDKLEELIPESYP